MPFSDTGFSGCKLLIEHFESFHQVSPAMQELIYRDCFEATFKKGKYIASPLDIKPSLYFIIEGSVRGFVRDGNDEITTWLSIEQWVVGLTLFEKHYSVQREQFVQALEHTQVVVIPYSVIMELFNFPEMGLIARDLLWKHYQESDERNFLIRIPSAEKRIQRLMETHPLIFNRISSKHLAGYLGIRQETLSRVKGKLLRSAV